VRVCAVRLPELRVELVRESDPSLERVPLAIVVAPPPLTEAKLLGNTRIDVVSREAAMLGVKPGQTIAQARARAGALAVRVVRPDAVTSVLARLAEIALAFGATVSFAVQGEDEPGDVVRVDVTGCAHLHAKDPREGEAILASRLASVFESLGHRCAVAVADGPRVAGILARVARPHEAGEAVVVPPGDNARVLAPLPVGVLPLAEADVRWLTKLGVRSIEDLRALPRSGLASRLGARAPVILSLMDGDDRAPLRPYVPPEIPEEEATLEYGIEGTDALTFVAKTLADRLSARLAGRAVAASRIELELGLDAAMLEDRSNAKERLVCELPAPLSTAGDLLAALRPKLERLALRAPVLSAKLRAPTLVHKPQAALSLFEAQPKAERALPRLVAELAADLGAEAVGTLVLGDSWVPEDRSRFVSLDRARALRSKKKKRHLVSSVPEPTRILPEPEVVPRDAVKVVRHLSRTEALEWWKQMPGSGGAHAPRGGIDHVYAWVADAAAWVEIDRRTGATRVRGWFD
jgi:protein ImuB